METFNVEHFKHFVPVSKNAQKVSWKLMDHLIQFKLDDYMILYNCWTPSDGEWHSAPKTVPVFVAFRNKEDAVTFRLSVE